MLNMHSTLASTPFAGELPVNGTTDVRNAFLLGIKGEFDAEQR